MSLAGVSTTNAKQKCMIEGDRKFLSASHPRLPNHKSGTGEKSKQNLIV